MLRFHNQRIAVYGLGKSGFSAVRRLAPTARAVLAVDDRPRDQFRPGELADLAAIETLPTVRLVLGTSEATDLFHDLAAVILSPGVPPDRPFVARARAAGVAVFNEAGLALADRRGPVTAVTGSAGKTTTCTLIDQMLSEAGLAHDLGGNMGTPLLEFPPENADRPLVAELSSYQIELLFSARLATVVFTTLVEDHLDRYGTMENYFAAKARLIPLASIATTWILNPDNPFHARLSQRIADDARGEIWWYTRRTLPAGARGIAWDAPTRRLRPTGVPLTELTVPAHLALDHNVENFMTAALAVARAGAPTEAVQCVLDSFRGAPHRLEFVGEKRGVRFFNDSKATNTASVLNALGQFAPSRVVLLAGGKDKGIDFAPLVASVREKCRRVIVFGEARRRIREALPAEVPIEEIESLEAATTAAFASAEPGDVVLLSPACASQDRFANYEERGNAFKAWVEALT